GSGHEVRIVDVDGQLVGTVDLARAPEAVHPGAVYLHQGQAYRVVDLDLVEGEAVVEPSEGEEYTQVRSETAISILHVDAAQPVGAAQLHLGVVEVANQVVGYERHDARTGEVLGRVELTLPANRLE